MTVADMPSQLQQIRPGDGDQLFLLGKNFNDFLSTAAGDRPALDRWLWADPPQSFATIRAEFAALQTVPHKSENRCMTPDGGSVCND